MIAYLAWWFAGGIIGSLAGLLVLRGRGLRGWRMALPFLAAIVGCLYGAKVQHRLRHFGVLEALAVPPEQLFDPGFHIPLGLVMGFLAAMVMSRLARLPLLAVADALAVTGAVLMPIGRLGCLLAGCCTGDVCPAWLNPICIQKSAHEPEVHLLPAYFALLGMLMLAVDLWLLRRRARPGTLIAWSFFVYPAGQLAIELVRGEAGDRTGVMTAVLASSILANVLVHGWLLVRRRLHFAAPALRVAPRLVGALALMLLTTPGVARAADAAQSASDWQQVLQRYAQEPAANRRALFRVARRSAADLPPVFRIAVADAHMRAGHLRTAAQQFEDMMKDESGQPWRGLAAVGRGWIAARRGELEGAREYFAEAATAPGSTGLLGDVLVGMLDAGAGAVDEAAARFARVAAHPEATNDLRLAATMGEGYAKLWTGDDAGAIATFQRARTSDSDSGLGDDARYAAALAQWRQGDRVAAEEALRELADAKTATPGARASLTSLRLDPRGLVRGGARRYRELPLRMPADQVLAVLDGNVRPMARSALRKLAAGAEVPVHRVTTASAGTAAPRPATMNAPRTPREADGGKPAAPRRPSQESSSAWDVLERATVWLTLGTLALVAWLNYRRIYA